jgi:hypothetical protein
MEDAAPPRTEDLVPVFRHLYEACMDRRLPIGAAPNVHVSLVLLPEECRGFSSRSDWAARARLRALRSGLTFRLRRRMRQARRRYRNAGAGPMPNPPRLPRSPS